MPNNCAIRYISFTKTFSKFYFIELNFICYDALNDIRYFSAIDFKYQIQDSQKPEDGIPYFGSPGMIWYSASTHYTINYAGMLYDMIYDIMYDMIYDIYVVVLYCIPGCCCQLFKIWSTIYWRWSRDRGGYVLTRLENNTVRKYNIIGNMICQILLYLHFWNPYILFVF